MTSSDLSSIKTKLNDLDTKLSTLTAMFFSYQLATMSYLKDKGIIDLKEFEGYVKEAKKEYKKLEDDVDFMMLMKDFWKKKGK